MEQRNGLSLGFERGRLYERQETLDFVVDLLKLDTPAEIQGMLAAWASEACASLNLGKSAIIIEDTYIVI